MSGVHAYVCVLLTVVRLYPNVTGPSTSSRARSPRGRGRRCSFSRRPSRPKAFCGTIGLICHQLPSYLPLEWNEGAPPRDRTCTTCTSRSGFPQPILGFLPLYFSSLFRIPRLYEYVPAINLSAARCGSRSLATHTLFLMDYVDYDVPHVMDIRVPLAYGCCCCSPYVCVLP